MLLSVATEAVAVSAIVEVVLPCWGLRDDESRSRVLLDSFSFHVPFQTGGAPEHPKVTIAVTPARTIAVMMLLLRPCIGKAYRYYTASANVTSVRVLRMLLIGAKSRFRS